MFAIGEPPTGSKDPFALRRSAIGVINILRERLGCGFEKLVDAALASYAEQGITCDASAVSASIVAFLKGRMEQMARDAKIPADESQRSLRVASPHPVITSRSARL